MAKFTVNKSNIKSSSVDPEKIWGALVGFAHYAFNKSHSVAYAIIAYHTADIWVHSRNEMMQYLLNHGAKDRYQQALDKLNSLPDVKMNYPDIHAMMGEQFRVVRDDSGMTTCYMPINAPKNYDNWVSFLFNQDDDVNTINLIYKGVADSLTNDRTALATLVSTLQKKHIRLAQHMGDRKNLRSVLDGLLECGALTEVEPLPDGSIRTHVVRARSKPTEVIFHTQGGPWTKADRCRWDIKMFGAVRNGVLSDLPDCSRERTETLMAQYKEKLEERERPIYHYRMMCNWLKDWMRDNYQYDRKRIFYDVYALLQDVYSYSTNTKLTLMFNNLTDIFYMSNRQAEVLKRLPKNTLVRMKMEYSPYINKRKCMFIYDFDILEIEPVTI